mmetsp:Transcript_80270/g.142207  ORF Transcript_80270/g.142207 Transcript_80270/m.142207 type:complete len:232 (-) Transcript_80270:770-1465(-)
MLRVKLAGQIFVDQNTANYQNCIAFFRHVLDLPARSVAQILQRHSDIGEARNPRLALVVQERQHFTAQPGTQIRTCLSVLDCCCCTAHVAYQPQAVVFSQRADVGTMTSMSSPNINVFPIQHVLDEELIVCSAGLLKTTAQLIYKIGEYSFGIIGCFCCFVLAPGTRWKQLPKLSNVAEVNVGGLQASSALDFTKVALHLVPCTDDGWFPTVGTHGTIAHSNVNGGKLAIP